MNQSVVAIITGPNNFVLQGKQIGGEGRRREDWLKSEHSDNRL